MHDQAMVWNTDTHLHVTSLTARLRDVAGHGMHGDIHVSDLWGQRDALSPIVVAHQWALDGESLSFDAVVRGLDYHFDVHPLHDPRGRIVGVTGRARERAPASQFDRHTLSAAEHAARMGSWCEDLRTGTCTISEGLALLLGRKVSATFDIRAFDHPEDRERVAREIKDGASKNGYSCDHRILSPQSRVRTVRERVHVMADGRGVPIARIGTMLDISDLKEREAALEELALVDALTRLPNRIALEERLCSSISRSARSGNSCAVLFVDLDEFKVVNDRYGHAFGDRVLRAVADRLVRHVRASDTVARFGGDEFLVLIDDLYSDDAAVDAGRKVLQSLNREFLIEGHVVQLGASIGVATFPRSGGAPAELVAIADREMYAVKRNGGNAMKLAGREEERAMLSAENDECRAHSSPEPSRFATAESA
jgi:diguanylate cyclase (GGDEF)-like protein